MIVLALVVCSLGVNAQTSLPVGGFMNYLHPGFWNTNPLATITAKKWALTPYSGVSAGFQFFNGGQATIVSVPVGLQLTRRLNENLYAFAAISAAPSYTNFNGSFSPGGFNKDNGINSPFKYNTLAMYGKAELGLMYVNDAKTFSISGSVGVQRSVYPGMPYYPTNSRNQNLPVTANR
jgi:hypothetical protein